MSTVRQMSHFENTNLKTKKDLHLARKIWHTSGVLLIVFIFDQLPILGAQMAALVASIILISLDYRRLQDPKLNKFAQKVLGPVMRSRELTNLSGLSFLLAGLLILVLFFPPDIIRLSLIFLAFADPIAAFVGQKWGRDQLVEGKSVQGFLAAFVACAFATGAYLYYYNLGVERLFIIAPLAGLSGAIAESLPIKKLDDNFTLPVLSAVSLYILFYLFGLLGL